MHKERLAKISKGLDKAKINRPGVYHHIEDVDLKRIETELGPRRKKSRTTALADVDFDWTFNLG